jgi:ribose transport system ATP-binding protein
MESNTLELKGIAKKFGATQVLSGVDLSLSKGELHALMGENGAGKSTLIKIISGVHRADEGEIYLNGKKVEFHNPHQAQVGGISTLFQELQEIPDMTVAENLFTGMKPRKFGIFVDWKKMFKDAQKWFDESHLNIDASQKMHSLPPSSRKMVEIIRGVHHRNASVIIMDEPTANLNQDELDAFFSMIEELKRKHVTIIYVSHRLREIFQLADRVSVLRDGRLIKTMGIADCTEQNLIRLMIGRDLPDLYPEKVPAENEIAMRVRGLSVERELEDVTFDVRNKEIVGIAGLEGSGATSVIKALFGLKELKGGSVELDGRTLQIKGARNAIAQGLAYVPEDRKTAGLFLNQNVAFNVTVSALDKKFSHHGFILKKKAEQAVSKDVVKNLSIKVGSSSTKVRDLSGGNQQKVLIGRWLADSYKALLLEEPTRGVDIGAKVEIYQEISKLVESGMLVLMYSSELLELLGMCDRVIVFRSGKISAILSRDEMTEEKIMEHAVLK